MSPLLLLAFLGCAPNDAEVTAHWWAWLAANSSAAVGEGNLTDLDAVATRFECSGRGWNLEEGRWDDGYIGPRESDDLDDPRFVGGACRPTDEDPNTPSSYCASYEDEFFTECYGDADSGKVGAAELLSDDGYYGLQGSVTPWRTEALLNGEGDLQLAVHHQLEPGQDFRFVFSVDPDFEPTRCISTENGAEIQQVDGDNWVDQWSADEDGYRIYYLNAGAAQPQSGSPTETGVYYLTTDWLTGYGYAKFAGEEFNSVSNRFSAAIPDDRRASCTENMDNVPPLCDAGADVLGEVGVALTLSAAGSEDVDGDALSYVWTSDQFEGVDFIESQDVSWTPTEAGTFTFAVNVSDGAADCRDTVRVVVPESNSLPLCDIGIDLIGDTNTTIAIDASASDADGDPIAYQWEVTDWPVIPADDTGSDDVEATFSLGDATAGSTTFTGDLPGAYELTFTACEGGDCSASGVNKCERIMTVTLEDAGDPADNHPPLCDINADISGDVSGPIALDGTGTTDPDGDTLTYKWAVTGRPTTAASRDITDDTELIASYLPTASGTHEITLTVSEEDDGDDTTEELSCSKSFNFNVINLPPLCPSSKPVYAADLADVVLDFSGATDPDGDDANLTYEWTWPTGGGEPRCGDAEFSPADGTSTTLERQLPGEHTVTVKVSDGGGTCSAELKVLSTCNDEFQTELACLEEDYDVLREAWVEGIGAFDPKNPSEGYQAKFEDNAWRPVDEYTLGLDGWAEVHTSWVRIKNTSTIEPGGSVEGDYQIEYQGSLSASVMLVRGTFKVDKLREDPWAYSILEDVKRAETDETPGQKYCQ